VLSIIRVALLSMNRSTTLSYVGGIITFTPLSSLAWVSLDCLMPRTPRMFDLLPAYRLLVTAGMMGKRHTEFVVEGKTSEGAEGANTGASEGGQPPTQRD